MLPVIWKRAALLVLALCAAAGAAAFCVTAGKQAQDEGLLRVGYAAADNAVTDMAVSYVRQMESVKELCSIERVSEDEGFRLLREGALAAFVLLPDDIVGEIISGKNTPVTVYLSADNAPEGGAYGNLKTLLFRELADSAVGMLETAQAEIYAVQYLLGDMFYADNELVQKLYDDINRFNIAAASGRENLFRSKTVSATENDTYVIYYGSALLTLYMLLAGLFFGGFFCHSEMRRNMLEKRLGVSRLWQVICGFLAGLVPMCAAGLLPFVALALPFVRERLNVRFSNISFLFGAICLMVLSMAFGVLYFMLIYEIFGGKRGALAAIGIIALVQGYLSGCFVPSALLPDLAYDVGRYLPAAFLKAAYTVVLSGDMQKFSLAVLGLFVWSVVFFILNFLVRKFLILNSICESPILQRYDDLHKEHMFIPPVMLVLLKRMLLKKSILITLALMAAASVLIARLEAQSDNTVSAAVFDEGGAYEELLLAHRGIVRFRICESVEEVEELVLKDEAECGYFLPKTLTEDIAAGRANRTVTVYEDVDSVCVPIVNEVVFNAVFRHASLAWYQDFMSGFSADFGVIEKVFSNQITDGKTFGIELVTLGEGGALRAPLEDKGTYPVLRVVSAAVVLCGIQGFLTAMEDCRKGRLYKRGKIKLAVMMVVLPMLAAAAVGGVLLWCLPKL